jgi:hypothetical protein
MGNVFEDMWDFNKGILRRKLFEPEMRNSKVGKGLAM